MKKIILFLFLLLLAFPALATVSSNSSAPSHSSLTVSSPPNVGKQINPIYFHPPVKKRVINSACLAPAVNTREIAISNAFDVFSSSEKTALQTRRNELNTAWGNSDVVKRNAAVKAAWIKYQSNHKKAVQTYKASTRTANKAFDAAAKLCNVPYEIPVEDSLSL